METNKSNPIPPEQNDFKLLDSYINFSYEVMKFAILSIGGVWAALIAISKSNDGTLIIANENGTHLKLILAMASLILSVLLSLGHRYTASNSMANWVAYIREEDERDKEELRNARNRDFKRSGILIWLASSALVFGLAVSGALLYSIIT